MSAFKNQTGERKIKTVNVLKKYSRAAGDRNQWMKVEAMSCESSESARESFEESDVT
jgi:hypothetical protein